MNHSIRLTLVTLLLAVSNLSAATVRYVWQGSPSPGSPYTTWATAAHVIQDAVDAAVAGDRIVVTNGLYDTGGTAAGPGYSACRVNVNKAVALVSVNGPQVTVIRGDREMYGPPPGGHDNQVIGPQCVRLTDGASLTGFTLTNGMSYGGGGVDCPIGTNAVVTNCVIVGNSAPGYTANGLGGGAYGGALYNCLLQGNAAAYWGGGAARSILYNCTVVSNSAGSTVGVGGTAECTLYNCILYENTLGFDPDPVMNYDPSCTLTYCCASPLPSGAGNIDAYPEFVDYAGGNLRLQPNSPCIDAGTNRYAARPTDLDGRPRLVGRVDMGAYESQPSVSGAFIGWLQQWGLPTDGSADYADVDSDGLNNWQEWVCQTCPINLQSALRLLSASPAGTHVTVSWQSAAGVNYFLLRSPDLAAPSALVATNIPGQADTTTYADTNATGAGPFFYRVGVNAQ